MVLLSDRVVDALIEQFHEQIGRRILVAGGYGLYRVLREEEQRASAEDRPVNPVRSADDIDIFIPRGLSIRNFSILGGGIRTYSSSRPLSATTDTRYRDLEHIRECYRFGAFSINVIQMDFTFQDFNTFSRRVLESFDLDVCKCYYNPFEGRWAATQPAQHILDTGYQEFDDTNGSNISRVNKYRRRLQGRVEFVGVQ